LTVFGLLIVFSRRPDVFLNPQFWAEDGNLWYAQAFNDGILSALLTPEAGYFQTISRLVAAFSQIFPLEFAPLIFNLSAVGFKLTVAGFLLSKRLSNLLPDAPARFFAAFIYLALPHTYETHANLTNVQWHLALLAFLVIIAAPTVEKSWKIFDFATLALSALSGPFCLLLAPLAGVKFWHGREKRMLYLVLILGAGCLIQSISLLLTERPSAAPLGASMKLFLKIVGGHLFVSSIIGENGYAWTLKHPFWKDGVAIFINLLGFALLIYAFIKAKIELRLLIIFAALIAAAALISPAVTKDTPQWEAMLFPLAGSRYWLIPIFCFLLVLFWLARNAENRFFRYLSFVLLVFAPIGIVNDWQHPPFKNLDFPKYAAEFKRAESGKEIIIPINPDKWEMRLKKK
jgi:hypothetical protein